MASCSHQPPPLPDPAIPTIPSQPSDTELAMMLRAHVDPSASPPAAGNTTITIHDADVYAQEPADLTQQFAATVDAEDGQLVWYFFTMLSQRGKRKRRCMESGVWRGEGKSKPVVGSEAKRYLLAFLNNDGIRTGWIMHEFRLSVPDGNNESPVVLCKVFRSSRQSAANPVISAATTAEAQAQAQAEVEVVEEEALVNAVDAREAAVKAREVAVAAREVAVEAREALVRRDAAASERNLQERQSNLAAREAAVEAREAAWQETLEALRAREAALPAVQSRYLGASSSLGFLILARPYFAYESAREAELAREAEVREAEGEALARRDAARLPVMMEREPQERERDLEPWELDRLQAIYEELEAELEALLLILMAAIMMAAREGLLLRSPIAGGSRAAIAHCGAAQEPLF